MRVNTFKCLVMLLLLANVVGCGTVKNLFVEEVYEAPPTELTEFSPEFLPELIWTAQAGEGAGETSNALGLWIQNESLYSVDSEGEVFSFNLSTGRRQWDIELEIPVVAGIGGGAGMVLVGSQKGELIALSDADGTELWRQQLSSEVLAQPKASSAIVAVRTADGRVTGLATDTGEVKWSYQRTVPLLSLRGASAPVIDQDKVLAGYDNGKLVALSSTDGKVIWEKSVAVPRGRTELDRLVDIDADPVVVNDTVYAVTFHGNVAALATDTGYTRWSREMSSQSGIAVAYGDAVYVTDDESYVWAIQDSSGDALWRQTRLLRRQLSSPEVAGRYVVVGDFEGYVHWIARDDGRFVARQQVSDSAIKAKPLVHNGVAYFIAVDGSISAVRVP